MSSGRPTLVLLVLLVSAARARAQPQPGAPEPPPPEQPMSLTDLLEITTTAGSLTGTTASKTPVSVTTITAEEIALSPARNLYDLIEIYVPGAFVMNHNDDFHPGIRGIIADRNLKFLLLVNGRNMNQKGHAGATAELDNWDLNDIAQVEVIRGPGSVTYGPGAILGVINITTKDAQSGQTQATIKYVAPYNSGGVSVSAARRSGGLEVYGYASVVRTTGVTPPFFAGDKSNNVGYVGQSFPANSPYALETQDYFRDYLDNPQLKLHLDIKTTDGWDFWARYTTSGLPTPRSGAGAASKQVDATGELLDFKGFTDRRFTATGANQHAFGSVFTLKSMLSWSLEDFNQFEAIIDKYQLSNLANDKIRFSENELFARVLGVIRHSDRISTAVGFEYSHQSFGPGLGASADTGFKMGDSSDIVSGSTSQTVDANGLLIGGNGSTTPIFAGTGWSTDTFSGLAEANLELHPLLGLIVSGRVDKNTYSKYLVSPRLVLLSQVGKETVIKAIVQQSKRMNTAEQLFVQHRSGSTSDPETLSGAELAVSTAPRDHLLIEGSAYYNLVDVLAWNGKNATIPVGKLSLAGGEAEARYSAPGITVGLNQSYVKQIHWRLAADQTGSGISYSDFNRNVDAMANVVLHGVGNDLNNVPLAVTKLYASYTWRRLTGHADGHVFWGWPGLSDGLTSLQDAAAGTPKQGAVDQGITAARDRDIYGVDVRVNLSLKLQLTRQLSLMGYVINLIGNRGNRRYSYDAGINSASPNRIGWVEEPRAFGVELKGAL
jgi:outer membrane receptor protein involved in Fe transport